MRVTRGRVTRSRFVLMHPAAARGKVTRSRFVLMRPAAAGARRLADVAVYGTRAPAERSAR
jgi:hypothetical protein